MGVRNWYFATNAFGLTNAFDQIRAAVFSAKAKTSLKPHAIIDDTGATDEILQRIEWLTKQGVNVTLRKATLAQALVPYFGSKMDVFSGHWLRCDIPIVESVEEYVLYTDIDVIFEADVAQLAPSPSLIGCSVESQRDDLSHFNSGVMVINVPEFRRARANLIALLHAHIHSMDPWDDQTLLNRLFAHRWHNLGEEWNWKPYWGINEHALIVHWHGPKPADVREMLASGVNTFGGDFGVLYGRGGQAYQHYLRKIEPYL